MASTEDAFVILISFSKEPNAWSSDGQPTLNGHQQSFHAISPLSMHF